MSTKTKHHCCRWSMHFNFCMIHGYYTEETEMDGAWSPTAAFTGVTGSANDDKREDCCDCMCSCRLPSQENGWTRLPFSSQQQHPKLRAQWSWRAIIIYTPAGKGWAGCRVARNSSFCCHEFHAYLCIFITVWIRWEIIFSPSLYMYKVIKKEIRGLSLTRRAK